MSVKRIVHFIFLLIIVSGCNTGGVVPPTEKPVSTEEIILSAESKMSTPTLTEEPAPMPSNTPAPSLLPDYSNATVETLVFMPETVATGGVTIDAEGNLYVADIGMIPLRNGRSIYKITPDGEVSLLIESEELNGASGNIIDMQGDLFQSSFTGNTVHKITSDGELSLFTNSGIVGPVGLVFDADGNLFVANCRGASIQKISATGESVVFASRNGLDCPNGITIDERGNVYVANFSNGKILKITQAGDVSLLAELPGGNNGHIAYRDGILYTVDRGSHQVYAVHVISGEVKLVAGSGARGLNDGSGIEATFSLPNGIAISPDGTRLYINHVVDITGRNNYPVVVRTIILNLE